MKTCSEWRSSGNTCENNFHFNTNNSITDNTDADDEYVDEWTLWGVDSDSLHQHEKNPMPVGTPRNGGYRYGDEWNPDREQTGMVGNCCRQLTCDANG